MTNYNNRYEDENGRLIYVITSVIYYMYGVLSRGTLLRSNKPTRQKEKLVKDYITSGLIHSFCSINSLRVVFPLLPGVICGLFFLCLLFCWEKGEEKEEEEEIIPFILLCVCK